MGYQVGRICYRTEKEATDVVMSQVIPSFDKDGNLNMPFYNGRSWMYEHQRVKMSFRTASTDNTRHLANIQDRPLQAHRQ